MPDSDLRLADRLRMAIAVAFAAVFASLLPVPSEDVVVLAVVVAAFNRCICTACKCCCKLIPPAPDSADMPDVCELLTGKWSDIGTAVAVMLFSVDSVWLT